MRPLTPTEASELRHERDAILAKIAEVAPLRRRLRVVEGQLLSGLFAPGPGVLPEQLSLTPEDKADLADAAEEGAKSAAAEAKSKATKRPAGKASKAVPAPMAPPQPPADTHPQLVLRSWLWTRLEQTAGLTVDQLAGELVAFDREDVQDTLNLLYSCNLVGDRDAKGGAIWWATEMPAGTTVDRVVLDVVLVNVRDEGPLSDQDLERILGVSEGLAACLLDELHEAGRIEPATREASGVAKTWRVAAKKHAKKAKNTEVTS